MDRRVLMPMERGLREFVGNVPDLTSNWDFTLSEPGWWIRMRRAVWPLLHGRRSPLRAMLKPVRQREAWFAYFVYAPDGCLTDSHRFTLHRLRDMGHGVLVVCAAPSADAVPADLFDLADALYWKAPPGYDFSAYTMMLEEIAQHSPHATVFVLNDSIFGPFVDLRPFMDRTPWELTGFTASSLHENHVQSYAFVLRDVSPQRLAQLRPAFPQGIAYSHGGDVILCQELYFARVASRHMSVGACWYSVFEQVADATLVKPLQLLDAGFPFMKKSVLGKHYKFQLDAQHALRERLAREGHPLI